MGKILKTTKDKLVELLNITDQVPSTKLASDIGKHLGFRKAIKKHLKDYTDAKATAISAVREEQRKIRSSLQPIENKLRGLQGDTLTNEQNDEKKKLEGEQSAINSKFQVHVDKMNRELEESGEDLQVQKVEVTFDNEDFLFEKNVIIDNATTIFKAGEDRFNADAAEDIFDLFDSVK